MACAPTLRLIGAPTDIGASRLGSAMGPDALRVAGLGPALRRLGRRVHDTGNLAGPPNPQAPPEQGLRHLAPARAWMESVHQAVGQALADGELPLMLGGDHSLAMGSIGAVAAHCRRQGRALRVVWLDAHADCNTPEISPSGNLHGMPLAVLCGHGPEALRHLASPTRDVPALQSHELRLIGVRSVDPLERQFVHSQGLEVFDMRSLDEQGMRRAMAQALMGVGEHTHLHISFDVDFLDPDIAPGVGTPVRGGPSYREAQLCMEMLADTGCIGSLDVVELNPARDIQNRTAELVVDLLESLFGKSTLMRPRS